MKKNFLMAVMTILACNIVTAQNRDGDATDVTKITLLLPGFSYEKRIGKLQTIHVHALMNLSAYTTTNYYGTESIYYIDPSLLLEYRYYVNYERRTHLRKSTDRNTMNYVGALSQVTFSKMPVGNNAYESSGRRPVYMFGAIYGLQRNYKSRFSLDLNFGLGVIVANTRYETSTGVKELSRSQATIPGQITLGFWLNKR